MCECVWLCESLFECGNFVNACVNDFVNVFEFVSVNVCESVFECLNVVNVCESVSLWMWVNVWECK